MSEHYGQIAFTPHVRDTQAYYGSAAFYARHTARSARTPGPDPLTANERSFLTRQDGFFLATVSDTGWPYVQFRGGPPGFLKMLDEHTLGWADFQGNLQYVSIGNLAGNARVALIVVDYVQRRRLKVFGRARVAYAEQTPELTAELADPGYDALVERVVRVSVEAFDWNCPQHIPQRWGSTDVERQTAGLAAELSEQRAENARLRQALFAARQEQPHPTNGRSL